MLFNSFEFLCLFLPVALAGFFFIARFNCRLALLWLAVASLFFYGWWNPKLVFLLLASIAFNYGAGRVIERAAVARHAKRLLVAAVAANLVLLAIFKYANFFIATADDLGEHWRSLDVVLPLGISFFTFTQIAFLVDVHRRAAREYNFVDYLLFVTWFPHLIAGPVLHHQQMMPQFSLPTTYVPSAKSIAIGLTFFAVGLFKKVLLADNLAAYANPAFDAAAHGSSLLFVEAWVGAIAFGLQLYFDFSGYSDMAVGVSRMFNITLPFNFNSPYKAASIVEFWRRWHMSLSAFLRDYLYLPLGGNRKGPVRRYVNVLLTMLLGGLWHGAGWNFVLWGGLHGAYLLMNHGWRHAVPVTNGAYKPFKRATAVAVTFTAVMIAWVPFRAANLQSALSVWASMVGLSGVTLTQSLEPSSSMGSNFFAKFVGLIYGLHDLRAATAYILVGVCIIWAMPNTQQFASQVSVSLDRAHQSGKVFGLPVCGRAIFAGTLLGLSVLSLTGASDFLYFQF